MGSLLPYRFWYCRKVEVVYKSSKPACYRYRIKSSTFSTPIKFLTLFLLDNRDLNAKGGLPRNILSRFITDASGACPEVVYRNCH